MVEHPDFGSCNFAFPTKIINHTTQVTQFMGYVGYIKTQNHVGKPRIYHEGWEANSTPPKSLFFFVVGPGGARQDPLN